MEIRPSGRLAGTSRRTDRRTDKQKDRRTDKQMDRRTDVRTYGWGGDKHDEANNPFFFFFANMRKCLKICCILAYKTKPLV
jgi:hypothetical protein